jgi:hypothetical protein
LGSLEAYSRLVEWFKRDAFVWSISDISTNSAYKYLAPPPFFFTSSLNSILVDPLHFNMARFNDLLIWVIAIYHALYDLISRDIRAALAIFKAPQAGPLLPIAVTRESFGNEFDPVEGGIRKCLVFDHLRVLIAHQPYHGNNSTPP